MTSRDVAGDRLAVAAALFIVMLVVWGLFAPDRGYLQDEPWIFAALRDGRAEAGGVLWVGRESFQLTPLRPLAHVYYWLAAPTPSPRLAMQALQGLTWLAGGLLAAALMRRLRPGRPLAAFAAAVLALTACGDQTVNHLAYVSSYAAAAGWWGALVALIAWERGGSRVALALMAVSLAFGLLTYDGVVAAAVFTPLLPWCLARLGPTPPDARRRRFIGVGLWCALLAPYLAAFAVLLRTRGSYLDRMVARPAPGEWAEAALRLFALNFTPWEWRGVFARPEDGSGPALVFGAWRVALVGAGLLACVVVGLRLARRDASDASPAAGGSVLRAVLGLVAGAAFSNAAVALVSTWPFRTQLTSRLLIAFALALVADAAAERWANVRPRLARLPWLLPAAFTAWGLDAGLASQDFHLTLWRRHRVELRSLLDQVPGLQGDAWLLLRLPPDAPLTSFYYPEVGGPWLDLLYGRPPQVVFWDPRSGRSACALQGEAFFCRDVDKVGCYATGECSARVLPVARTVFAEYVTATGRVELHRTLPRDVLDSIGGGDQTLASRAYAPAAAIEAWPRSPHARDLLDPPELVARFLPRARP